MTEKMKDVAKILRDAAKTYEARNKTYGNNFHQVGEIMAVMFPEGMTLKTAEDFKRFHIFDWMVGKLTRFAATGLTSTDSVHDLIVYSAIMEAITNDKQIGS